MKTCSVEGCEGEHWAKSFCHKHYQKNRKYSDPLGSAVKPLSVRFFEKVQKSETCWNWTGSKTHNGYGQIFTHGRTGKTRAHRVSYEMHKGPIPDGMVVDHTCFNHSCVNPSHLRLATLKQNQENREGAARNSKTGVRGVSWEKRSSRYLAVVVSAGKRYQVGRYHSIAEAEAAVIAKRNEVLTHNIQDRRAA